jgi:hypothetical protein
MLPGGRDRRDNQDDTFNACIRLSTKQGVRKPLALLMLASVQAT